MSSANGRQYSRPRSQAPRQMGGYAGMMQGMQGQQRNVLITPQMLPTGIPGHGQPVYMHQPQPQVHYTTNPAAFNLYQQQYPQQQLLRQQPYSAAAAPSHHYNHQSQQMLPIATGVNSGMTPMMPDNSAMLAGTTPPLSYMQNAMMMQQQHNASVASVPTATVPAKPSKAIKIVNPETLKELDTSNLKHTKSTSPGSSARSTPKPAADSELGKHAGGQALDSKGGEVTRHQNVTPAVIIRKPVQPEQQTVAVVTTDSKSLLESKEISHDPLRQSTVGNVTPSISGVQQIESVSELTASSQVNEVRPEQLTGAVGVGSSSIETLLPEQHLPPQLTVELSDHIGKVDGKVETTKVIQDADETIMKVKEIVDKPDVTMETLQNIGSEIKSDGVVEPGMESCSEKEPNHGVTEPTVEVPNMEPSMEPSIEKHDVEEPNMEKDDVEEMEEAEHSVEQPTVEDHMISMEQSGVEDHMISMEQPGVEDQLISMEQPGAEDHMIGMEQPDVEDHMISMEQPGVEDHMISMEQPGVEDHMISLEQPVVEDPRNIGLGNEVITEDLGVTGYHGENNTEHSSEDKQDEGSSTADEEDQYYEEISEGVISEGETDDIVAERLSPPATVASESVDDARTDPVATGDEVAMTNGDEELEEGEIEDDGRPRKYERDFLLSLQFLDQCKLRPPNLTNAEYIKKDPRGQSEGRPDYYDAGGGMNRRRGMSFASKKKIELPSKEQVELRKAEKKWVRPSEVPSELGAELAEADKETQELFRKFVGVLNKLTPQKFETLANQALQMPINTEERLKGCIDRIFIKALEEPNFSVAYAQLCRVLSKVAVEVGTGPEAKKKTFRSLLLTKCQLEFEKDKESDNELAKLRKKMEEAATTEEKKQLEEELNEKGYRVRHNYLGNIRFIGELFKIKMLSEGIMHECIRRLLQSTADEEALECFAKLMFTIGKDLDHEKGHALIKQYMDRVELIIHAGKVSSRIKFFLQDVVELRNANWVPRRENNNPKKIDQIHEEAKQEEAEKMRELAAHAGPPMGGRQVSKGSLGMDHKKGSKDGGSKMGSDWSVGGDKDRKPLPPSSHPKLDSKMFRNIGKPGTTAQISLAPPGKVMSMSMRPGGVAASVDKISRQEPKSKPSRSSGSGKRSDSRGTISGAAGGSGSTGSSGAMGGARRSVSAPDKQKERRDALELATTMSSAGSRSSSRGAEGKPVSVLKRPIPDALSEEEVEKKSSSLIAEFCQNLDYEAAVAEVKDMKSPGRHNRMVCQIINDVLEKPAVARSNTGKLFRHLIVKKVVSKEKFMDGFAEVLEFAEDIEIDVPKIWLYLAETVVPVIEDGTISLDILTKAPSSVMETGKGAQLLAEVLKLSEKIMGSGQVTVMWTNSAVSYSHFRISNVEEFRTKHGLHYLPSVSGSSIAQGVDVKHLMELLRSRDNTNSEIMNSIEKEFPESRERSLVFIRELGTAIFKAVIDGSGSNAIYNEELFESRIDIVLKYVEPQQDTNHQRQVEILYALQVVLHELGQPAGVASSVCRKLSDNGIFEDAAFNSWKANGHETIGHGATVMALKEFFDWLDATPVESDHSQ